LARGQRTGREWVGRFVGISLLTTSQLRADGRLAVFCFGIEFIKLAP